MQNVYDHTVGFIMLESDLFLAMLCIQSDDRKQFVMNRQLMSL